MKQPMHRNALAEGREHAGGPEGRDPGGSLVTPSLTRRGALGVLSAAAGVLAGCTALPSSSGVTRSGVAASDTNALIETAPGPGEGDSAEDIAAEHDSSEDASPAEPAAAESARPDQADS